MPGTRLPGATGTRRTAHSRTETWEAVLRVLGKLLFYERRNDIIIVQARISLIHPCYPDRGGIKASFVPGDCGVRPERQKRIRLKFFIGRKGRPGVFRGE